MANNNTNEDLENQMNALNSGCKNVVIKISNKMNDARVIEMWKALKTSQTQSINLYANRACGQLGELCRSLAVNCSLIELDLENFGLEDDGVKLVAKALEHNNALQILNLAGNQISHAGAKHLGIALCVNTCLRELNLRDNHLGNGGADELCKGIAVNYTLENLNLCKNEITNTGADNLARAVKQTYSIKILNLTKQYVSRKVMAKLKSDINLVQAVLTMRSAQNCERLGCASLLRTFPSELVRLMYQYLKE